MRRWQTQTATNPQPAQWERWLSAAPGPQRRWSFVTYRETYLAAALASAGPLSQTANKQQGGGTWVQPEEPEEPGIMSKGAWPQQGSRSEQLEVETKH